MPAGLPAQLSPWLISSRQDPRISPFFRLLRDRRICRSREMLILIGFAILSCCNRQIFGAPATYDQKQTGEVNVQIHLKDVQLVALLDSYDLSNFGDYDYEYEYLTESPIYNSTTASTLTTTEEIIPPLVTTAASEKPSNENNTAQNPDKNNTNEPETDNKNSSLDAATENKQISSVAPSQNATLDFQENAADTKTRINDKTGSLFTEKDIVKASGESSSTQASVPSDKSSTELQHRRKRLAARTQHRRKSCNPGNRFTFKNTTAAQRAAIKKLKGNCRRVTRIPYAANRVSQKSKINLMTRQ